MHWHDKPDLKRAKKDIPELLATNETAMRFFRYFAERRRSVPITDVPQLTMYIEKMFGDEIDPQELTAVIAVLFNSGFLLPREDNKRLKLHWANWIFPIFSSDKRQLIALETKPLKELQEDRNLLSKTLKKIEKYKATAYLPAEEQEWVPQIVFNQAEVPRHRTSLNQYSIEELLGELKTRGLKLQLNVSKGR